jgi:hypothetical protein
VESTILIDVWTVEPERQDELVRAISANLQRLVVDRPGFVSAEIYQSANRDIVVATLRMRTARERQALTDSPELEAAYRELRQVARTHSHVYRLAQSFRARPPGPKE